MKLNLKRMAAIPLIVLACISAATAQPNTARTSQVRVIHFRGDMAALLAQLADSFGLTIGLEADPKKPKSEVSLDLRDATLPDMLNGIVQSEPRYQWRESSGCIEVFPVSGSDPLLDTMISSFRVSDVTREEAIVQLMNLAEVRAVNASMNLNRRKATYPPSRNVEEKFSMLLETVTLRQALNRIATDSGAKFWLFRKYDDGSFSLSTSSW